jgi:hypothetical protein
VRLYRGDIMRKMRPSSLADLGAGSLERSKLVATPRETLSRNTLPTRVRG